MQCSRPFCIAVRWAKVRRRRRVWLLSTIGMLVLLAVLQVTGGMGLVSPSPELGTPAMTARELSPEERAYVEFVHPRLSALDRESADLVALGGARSQNVLALLQGQRRVETLIGDISAYIDSRGVPPAFESSAVEFASGAQWAQESIREARVALTRLDWEALGAAVGKFSLAASAFRSSASTLSREAATSA
jgi:hypothetical protein